MDQNNSTSADQFINIEKVLTAKNPGLKRIIPGFLINYLKRIVHQDEINAFISKTTHLSGLDFVDAIIDEFRCSIEINHLERIALPERPIVASNHPLGGLDGIGLMQTIGKVRRDVLFPVNDILMNLENLKPLFIPINKHGSNAENIQILNDTFAGNAVICYFPFGLVSRKKRGIIRDLEWKKTIISKAKKYKRDIIPTHISGRNTDFFYNLANLRKLLGIKANIEMLYLANEFYKQKNQKIIMTFAQPVTWQTFGRQRSDQEWAEQLRRYIYTLPLGNTEAFNPEKNYPLV